MMRLTDLINEKEPVFLTKAKKRGWVCPSCGNGKGRSGTGIERIPKSKSYKCFVCGLHEDLIGLYQISQNISDNREAIRRLCSFFGIGYKGHSPVYRKKSKYDPKTAQNAQQINEPEIDYTTFFLEANKHLNDTDYHRGISLETLNRFNVGYVRDWVHPKAISNPTVVPSPRLIIPTASTSYIARYAGEDKNRMKVGKVHILNIDALKTAKHPIFVVEGELDALSVIDVGGEAISFGGTSGIRILIDWLKENTISQPLVIALDSDDAGKNAAKELIKTLEQLSVSYYYCENMYGNMKDANEVLMSSNGREKLREIVQQTTEKASSYFEDLRQEEINEYAKSSVLSYKNEFIEGIRIATPCIPTGFSRLDYALGGGLYEGLYIIGAMPATGKTTLVLQIADQIAQQQEQDVLIFSLEMARKELIAKSLSRITAQQGYKISGYKGIADFGRTVREILNFQKPEFYSSEAVEEFKKEEELRQRAYDEYFSEKYAGHIFIHEGVGNIGTQQIRDIVQKHIRLTENNPVVVVDYIQILAPDNTASSDKQNLDKAVLELKRISRDYKIPVIGISSFNRASYKDGVKMEAFKESGGIEYSSDVLLGLQLAKPAGEEFNEEEARKKEIREIELKILKNRNGMSGGKVDMKYFTKFNYYIECVCN